MTAPALRESLGLGSATALLVGGVVGSGIFLVPGEMLAALPSVPACMAIWAIAGVLSFLGSLTFAELGSLYPEAGGEYVYLREAYGSRIAFLYGWILLAVIQSGSVAALAVAFGEYAGRLAGGGAPAAWATGAIVVCTGLNVRTARVAASLQAAVTAVKCFALLALTTLAFAGPGRDVSALTESLPGRSLTLAGCGTAMLAALWAYDGWNAVALVGSEIREPRRNLPRALVIGLGMVVVLYMATSAAYVVCLGPETVASSTQLAADMGRRVLGAAGERAMAGLIALSTFGTVLAMMLTCPRTYFAMAQDGLFFRAAATVHPEWGTPWVSVLLQGAWALVLLAGGSFSTLLNYVMFSSWLFYGLTAAGLIVLRRRRGGLAGPFATPGYPLTPVVFLAMSALLTLSCLLANPTESLLGVAMILAGLPLYRFTRPTPHLHLDQ